MISLYKISLLRKSFPRHDVIRIGLQCMVLRRNWVIGIFLSKNYWQCSELSKSWYIKYLLSKIINQRWSCWRVHQYVTSGVYVCYSISPFQGILTEAHFKFYTQFHLAAMHIWLKRASTRRQKMQPKFIRVLSLSPVTDIVSWGPCGLVYYSRARVITVKRLCIRLMNGGVVVVPIYSLSCVVPLST